MPIRTYLGGRTFDRETIQSMSIAFKGVCDALGLNPIDDAVTRLAAEKIIELAQSGVRGSVALHLMTIKDFKRPDVSQ
jgi:hypothetical protein